VRQRRDANFFLCDADLDSFLQISIRTIAERSRFSQNLLLRLLAVSALKEGEGEDF
jgi:hypothetical protein